MLILYIPSLPCMSEKTDIAPCFSLKIGRCDMTCFLLLCIRYDREVMFRLLYGYNTDIYIYDTSMPFITLTNTRACAS